MRRGSVAALAAGLLVLAGCSEKTTPNAPVVQPRLTGRAVVHADVRDAAGNLLDTATYPSVSGMMVELRTGGVPVDSVLTENGTFTFIPHSSGSQVAVANVAGEPVDSTPPLETHGTAASFPGALVFGTHGPIAVAPNPVGSDAHVQFVLPAADTVTITITRLSGDLVKTVLRPTALAGGVFIVTWDGTDEAGTPATPGPYWVVVDRRSIHVLDPLGRVSPARSLDIPPPVPLDAPEVMTTVVIKT